MYMSSDLLQCSALSVFLAASGSVFKDTQWGAQLSCLYAVHMQYFSIHSSMLLCALFDDKISIDTGARLRLHTALCLMAVKALLVMSM
jgi:hypothetical protein